MEKLRSRRTLRILLFALCVAVLSFGQGKKLKNGIEEERDHPRERDEWFRRGRPSDGGRAAEKLHRAYQQKMAKRAMRGQASRARAAVGMVAAPAGGASQPATGGIPTNGATWTALGPAPEASDSSGSGSQDYGPVTGRATAVAVDQTDPTGGTVYVGGAYGGVWKSTNASDATIAACGSNPAVRCAPNVTWRPVSDSQATLAVGSIAIKPDNNKVVLVGTGESNSAADSYYGLGILRSADASDTWTLITSAGTYPFRGLAFSRIAFATETVGSLSPNVVVASTAAASGGLTVGGEPTGATRGLYYSTDAGQTWSYRDSVTDGGGQTPSAGSAHSVIYFPAQHMFYAALRAHGIYSSSDGRNWTRLATQPGSVTLTACPTTTTNQALTTCPLYRAELAVAPGRNEMYVWMVDSNDNNQGIYQTRDGGNTWTLVNSDSIAAIGTEVTQGTYNLDLAAVPDGSGTDVYAGAVDQWKAILTDPATPSTWGAFINLTHVYECSPQWGSYSHVHPDEHSIDFLYSNPKIIYFANDGGIYRTLNSFASASGLCGTTPYPWDNLNSTMGSMTQYVWFTNHPKDPATLVGGTQDNGSPATTSGGMTQSWVSVNNGDGGYNAIDPNTPNVWYTSNTYLSIQRCASGINCHSGDFDVVIDHTNAGGDYGSFYTPYMLDPQNPAKVIVGTCRVWRGSADGTGWTSANALSYQNFDASLANQGACAKGSVTNPPYTPHNISALAAGGPKNGNGSQVIWAGTEQGKLFVTTNADGGFATWVDRTGVINPKNYPISSIALDLTDSTGQTGYITIMGFDVSHVWRTTNGGQTWTDWTGDLPNAPADAVVIDPGVPSTVYVGTDVGVFATTNNGATWTEVGLDQSGASTFPNVAITHMALMSGGATEHLRVSTYGRGVWDIDLGVPTDFSLRSSGAVTTLAGASAVFTFNVSSLGAYSGNPSAMCQVTLPGANCTVTPISLLAGAMTTTTVSVSLPQNATPGAYQVSLTATDPAQSSLTHTITESLAVMDFSLSPTPTSATVKAGGAAPYQINVTPGANGSISGTVTYSCSGLPSLSACNFSPASQVVGATSTSTQLSISTTAPSSARSAPVFAFWLPVAGIAVLGIGVRRRRFMLMLLLVAMCVLAALAGCGASHKITNPGTPAGTYTVNVSGTMGSAQRSTTVTLVVNSN